MKEHEELMSILTDLNVEMSKEVLLHRNVLSIMINKIKVMEKEIEILKGENNGKEYKFKF